eukprot:TRINITY_DN7743_c0_g1_i2.p1 TRINITY_DN7743_c0_g1~~TRINITY_DN7743_c0_g1_i2.p1  ORF type:complete len:146 (-),score=27.96 TRINITY_DN7743_c0_g1_i2:12-398(-)
MITQAMLNDEVRVEKTDQSDQTQPILSEEEGDGVVVMSDSEFVVTEQEVDYFSDPQESERESAQSYVKEQIPETPQTLHSHSLPQGGSEIVTTPTPTTSTTTPTTTISQIGRAVQQECRDRSRMPSSA